MRAAGIGVYGDHRLVVELAATGVEVEECHLRPGGAMVERFRDRDLGALDGPEDAVEENNDVAVVDIALGVERDSRVGTEVGAIRGRGGGQRQGPRPPAVAPRGRGRAAHWQPGDLPSFRPPATA